MNDSVFVMKREHGQMWPLIERLAAACDAAADRHAGADPAFMGALATASPPEGWKCEFA
ncbi:MAG: hypothetical protein KF790_08325 [Steroidobacteraceae bacterium]|nr:hypothetical protein [Steroidobacteraceae bacterium]